MFNELDNFPLKNSQILVVCSQMKTLLYGDAVTGYTGHSQTYYPGTHRREKKSTQRKAYKPTYYDIYMVVIIISFLYGKAFEG